MKLIPTKYQYQKWSLPSKLTMWGTLAGVASLFLAVLSYTYPLPKLISGGVDFGVSVRTANKICDSQEDNADCIEHADKLNYEVIESNNKIGIYPTVEQAWAKTGYFKPFNNKFRFPELDIKLVNNSNKTIFLDNVELFDISSKKDLNQIFDVETRCGNAKISVYQLNPNVQQNLVGNPFIVFTISNKNLVSQTEKIYLNSLFKNDKYPEIKLNELLLQIGVNMEELDKINSRTYFAYDDYYQKITMCEHNNGSDYFCKPAVDETEIAREAMNELRKFGLDVSEIPYLINNKVYGSHRNPRISGYIEYEIYDHRKQIKKNVKTKFNKEVYIIDSHGCGAPEPPSDTYAVMLEDEKSSYSKNIPISNSIKSNEVERITIKLGVPTPSTHKFRLKISSVSNDSYFSKPIEVYIPNM